jgi:hypothetical protein
MIKWLSKQVESEDLIQVAQMMKDQTYIHRIKDNNLPFVNDQTLYSFHVGVV